MSYKHGHLRHVDNEKYIEKCSYSRVPTYPENKQNRGNEEIIIFFTFICIFSRFFMIKIGKYNTSKYDDTFRRPKYFF